MHTHAKPKRSIVKSISWRVCASITTILLIWIISGKFALAFSVGLVEVIVKMIVYYFHERAWNNIEWGLYKIEE